MLKKDNKSSRPLVNASKQHRSHGITSSRAQETPTFFKRKLGGIDAETARLFHHLRNVGWTPEDCTVIAPLTLEINKLKKKQNAIILAHSYQTPDIMYGVADFLGDSYGLSKIAQQTEADTIIFCSVYFMAETAKILNPTKRVLVPSKAGCSLADSITAEDVRELKRQHPNTPIICYVNTSAEVKAESDIACTSSNVYQIVENLPNNKIIFIPDELMAANLRHQTDKQIVTWPGRCIVHETFTPESVDAIRQQFPNVKILAHPECKPEVTAKVDFVGSTTGMLNYIKENSPVPSSQLPVPSSPYMIISECGLTDRIKSENPGKIIVGTCVMCPYMKNIQLKDVLKCLTDPTPNQLIQIPADILNRAKKTFDEMYHWEKKHPEHPFQSCSS